MPYKYLEEIAIADVAFEATGKSLEEMFIGAAEALLAVMIKPEEVKPEVEHTVELEEESVERLLYDWLSELIYLKDADGLLFSRFDLAIHENHKGYAVKGKLYGEKINRKKHPLLTDVKAVTMHMFEVKKVDDGWRATVVLDV